MGKWDLPIVLGAVSIGAGFLFFTKPGEEILKQITDLFEGDGGEGEGEDEEFNLLDALTKDYPASVTRDPGAFIPGSDRWYDIVKKNRGKKAAEKLREMVLKKDLEAYFGSI